MSICPVVIYVPHQIELTHIILKLSTTEVLISLPGIVSNISSLVTFKFGCISGWAFYDAQNFDGDDNDDW